LPTEEHAPRDRGERELSNNTGIDRGDVSGTLSALVFVIHQQGPTKMLTTKIESKKLPLHREVVAHLAAGKPVVLFAASACLTAFYCTPAR
jgi:hypothetical protein